MTCTVLSSRGERQLGQELVPDTLWKIVEPLIPPQRERRQGGGTRYVHDGAVFTAIVCVLPAAAPGGTYRRSSASRRRPRTGGSWPGPKPGCGAGCTGRCWIGSANRWDRVVSRGGRCGQRPGEKGDR